MIAGLRADAVQFAVSGKGPEMAIYESEHTKFMREWLEKHPREAEEQKAGRALWWDKPQDADAQRRYGQAAVPVRPYYYDVNH